MYLFLVLKPFKKIPVDEFTLLNQVLDEQHLFYLVGFGFISSGTDLLDWCIRTIPRSCKVR